MHMHLRQYGMKISLISPTTDTFITLCAFLPLPACVTFRVTLPPLSNAARVCHKHHYMCSAAVRCMCVCV